MPTLYEWLVFFHILTAAVWLGGGVYAAVLTARVQRSDDPGAVTRMAADAEWVGMRVFMPATLILLLTGIYAVVEGPWEFSQAWISIGFAVWIISFALGAGYFGPEGKRIAALAAERGPADPDVRARIRRVTALSHVELLLLVVVVFVMVTKPGL